jgi:hypothetical protein
MPSKVKIGIAVDAETANKISEIALKIKRLAREGKLPKRGPGRSIGDGTVATTIVERVIRDYPELLKEFFEDEIEIGIGEKVEKHPKISRTR